jgi:hypothetical protein
MQRADRKRQDILDAIARLALVPFAVWTISVPLQWGVVAGTSIAAQAIAAAWWAIGIVAQLTQPDR